MVETTVAQVALTQTQEAQIDSLFFDQIKGEVPGCSCGVISDGVFIYKKSFGFADLAFSKPISDQTVFNLASVSKQFTATLVALVEKQGKLQFDDPITKYLADFPAYGDDITIRHLIHHTSGLRDFFALWQYAGYDLYDRTPEEAVYKLIQNQKELNADPGEEYGYSNTNYFLLKLIVEKVMGQTLQEVSRDLLFNPLGMQDSRFLESFEHVYVNLAETYWQDTDGAYKKYLIKHDINGDSGVLTTMDDMLKWDQNFYENRLGKGEEALVKTLETSMELNDGTVLTYSFGQQKYSYRGIPYFFHSGTIGGFRTRYIRFPDQKVSVVVLCNLLDYSPYRFSQRVSDIVLEEYFKEPAPAYTGRGFNREEDDTPVVSPDSLTFYTGIFYSREIDNSHRFYINNNKLYVSLSPMHEPEELRYVGDHTFEAVGAALSYTFNISLESRIEELRLNSNRVRNLKFSPHIEKAF